ncbi:MAG: hypothetical protein ACOCRN_03775 [Spirochaetia bacterium]
MFSESTAVEASLEKLHRSKKITVQSESRTRTRGWTAGSEPSDLIYIDVKGLSPPEQKKLLTYVLKRHDIPVGVLDPYDEVDDPAALFHAGVVDYAGSSLIADGLTAARVTRVLEWVRSMGARIEDSDAQGGRADPAAKAGAFGPQTTPRDPNGRSSTSEPIPDDASVRSVDAHAPEPGFPLEPVAVDNFVPSPREWAQVRGDQEYTFVALYIGLDIDSVVTRDTSTELVNNSIVQFQKVLKEVIEPYSGRLWFWKEFSGIILFPFDGASGDSIIAVMRIMLRRLFWQAEGKTNFVTKHFHMAMHVGNLVYHQGTGRETMVSDLVNFMFHFGGHYTPRNELLLTREILSRCPRGLRRFFRRHGTYEGLEIWSMQRPLTPREAVDTPEHSGG